MPLTELLALLTLFVGVPLNVVVAWLLVKHSRRSPNLRVLRERFIAAAAVLFLVVVFGLIFVNNDQPVPWLDVAATKLITRVTMLVVGIVPAAYWLWLYRHRTKKKELGKGESA